MKGSHLDLRLSWDSVEIIPKSSSFTSGAHVAFAAVVVLEASGCCAVGELLQPASTLTLSTDAVSSEVHVLENWVNIFVATPDKKLEN
jgi:hypothetical protein